jgi:hypothetical protein
MATFPCVFTRSYTRTLRIYYRTSVIGASSLQTLSVWYRINEGIWNSINVSSNVGPTYQLILNSPTIYLNDKIDYYFYDNLPLASYAYSVGFNDISYNGQNNFVTTTVLGGDISIYFNLCSTTQIAGTIFCPSN